MVLNARFFMLILCAFLVLGGYRIGHTASKHSLDPIKPVRTNLTSGYVVRTATEGELRQLELTPPLLPDLSPYTAEAVYAKLETTQRGRAVIRHMRDVFSLNEFTKKPGRLAEWATRQGTTPVAIVIEGGYVTPGDLIGMLPSEYIEQTAPGIFILRLPLVVGPDAALHIDASIEEFRLSEERGAFLVNDGFLFITDTALTGWRERENLPARFRLQTEFRPFVLSFGGSEIYIVNSLIASMGYAATKSYGVSISQYGPKDLRTRPVPRPTGWLINSTVQDNWYGLYTYEADDLVVLGNLFLENISYGIDPHDRSRRLIIANNIAEGTKKRHGIIISREVNDSWIFGNRSHHNRLSGIMIDRKSVNNVIANNQTHNNGSDGIAILESSNNLVWGNHIFSNAKDGIRVRNSADIRIFENLISMNKIGIHGYGKDLSSISRDTNRDPYEQQLSVDLVGGQLRDNPSAIKLDQPLRARLYRIDFSGNSRIRLAGTLNQYQDQLLDILVRQHAAAIIEQITSIP